ncbi:Phosphonate-binding protein [Rhodovastum atsumiense]|uniref:Phosphonate-binding protein n=1 Tax=Rhodovastum atsumiense TaxID=504468 RepID=A0A5M6IX41_9PROT|nr:photosynthetic complex assembly protein PuhC [Rhodovastum atsumiense]KAA5612900.1 phosphonate-binding protein [Rhodovastum atsumiense]CAH2601018.1 Phosphonate-binding protein [Rhodovastum atsumiense]
MSDPFHNRPIPRGVLIGAGLLIAFTITLAAATRLSGSTEVFAPTAAPVASRDLRFEDRPDGSIVVISAEDGSTVEVLAPGTNGFTRATLRGLARERKRDDLGAVAPFRLTRWADGRLTLEDVATGRRVDLEAFGSSNVQAFGRLLSGRSATP